MAATKIWRPYTCQQGPFLSAYELLCSDGVLEHALDAGIDLRDTRLCYRDAAALAPFAEGAPALWLDGNDFTEASFDTIVAVLLTNRIIRSLSLSRCGLAPRTTASLFSRPDAYTQLETLALNDNDLSGRGLTSLLSWLAGTGSSSLKALEIERAHLGPADLDALFTTLTLHPCLGLEQLSVSGNLIGVWTGVETARAVSLLTFVTSSRSLRTLTAARCALGYNNILALLTSPCRLRRLVLDDSYISADSELLSAIVAATSLRCLSIRGVQLPPPALAVALSPDFAPHLVSLDLALHKIGTWTYGVEVLVPAPAPAPAPVPWWKPMTSVSGSGTGPGRDTDTDMDMDLDPESGPLLTMSMLCTECSSPTSDTRALSP